MAAAVKESDLRPGALLLDTERSLVPGADETRTWLLLERMEGRDRAGLLRWVWRCIRTLTWTDGRGTHSTRGEFHRFESVFLSAGRFELLQGAD